MKPAEKEMTQIIKQSTELQNIAKAKSLQVKRFFIVWLLPMLAGIIT